MEKYSFFTGLADAAALRPLLRRGTLVLRSVRALVLALALELAFRPRAFFGDGLAFTMLAVA